MDVIHTVPLDQVKKVLQRWTEAIEKEVKMLFSSGALIKIPYQRAKALEEKGDLKIVPAKCVFTLKPPNKKGERCRRKCRMVICGNYINNDGEDQASLYAAGTSTDTLRLALSVASSRMWLAAIADITSAFLLAEWPDGMPKYALMQPKVIRDSGDYGEDMWLVQRPLYGLRESPMIWSSFRNMKLRQIKIVYRGRQLGLKQAVSDSELWLLRDIETGELYGLLVVYVDDLMYLAEGPVVEELHKAITALWPTSTLEWVDAKKGVRYLGVEIKQNPNSKAFTISQQAYIAELLRAHNMQDTAHTQLPLPREWLENLELDKDGELPFTEAELRLGQRYVGEALWLATKTRPDILYTVNAMASHVARKPLQVSRIGERLLSYLAGTSDLELVLTPPAAGEKHTMVCFTDASFAPFGSKSYGATVIVHGRAPVSWKAGRQTFTTMSTMEAELYAAAQGFVLLESVAAILKEMELGPFDQVLAIDNSSAVSMCAGGAGSQRTRHLKVRASYVREAVAEGRLIVRHTPGEEQLADLATKLVTKDRLWKLLGLWGFAGGKLAKMINALKMKMMAFALMLISLVKPADGRTLENPDKEAIQVTGWDELMVMALLVGIATIAVWEFTKHAAKFLWKQYKMAQKTAKMERVNKVAAETARREVAEASKVMHTEPVDDLSTAMPRTAMPRTAMPRTAMPSTAMSTREVETHATSGSFTPLRLRSQRVTEDPVTPPTQEPESNPRFSASPVVPREAEAYLPAERERVIKDTLILMTVEALRESLRCVGLPVSGLKADLIARLAPVLGLREPGAGSMQPTTKQLKYVLWLWREKSLSGRCSLTWHDVATRSEISRWIARWKEA